MTEFEQWLVENEDHFSSYTVEEIKERALLVGFLEPEVIQWAHREKFRGAA